MGDYNLTGLNSRDFEHIVQALAKKHIAAGVTIFGDGKDGGREATYSGKMDYPCKFCKRPTNDSAKDGRWAVKELERDLIKFTRRKRKLTKPDYYLFVTNFSASRQAGP